MEFNRRTTSKTLHSATAFKYILIKPVITSGNTSNKITCKKPFLIVNC